MNRLWNKEDISALFEQMKRQRVLVIGDVMIDSYLWGRVDRISPEAPVPVVNVTRRINRLGGAANVALNIKAMGAVPLLCTITGDDNKAGELQVLLSEEGLSDEGIIRSKDRITTTKFRVLGNNTQMLRVDEEIDTPIDYVDSEALFIRIKELTSRHRPNLIIFEDYDKGVITPHLIDNVVAMANANGIPVSVDPKKRNFTAYRNISLFKPNLKELSEGIRKEIDTSDAEILSDLLKDLREEQSIEMVLLTMSEAGVIISYNDDFVLIPSHVRKVADVSGAGDTVISLAALANSCGAEPSLVAALANLAGGWVCGHVGVVPVNREELLQAALKHLCHE